MIIKNLFSVFIENRFFYLMIGIDFYLKFID